VGAGQVAQVSGATSIEFTFDSDVNRVVVKVKSAETGEVVRQIPPEEYLRLVARFRELFGVVLDETA
jgi:flagellar protein FlaG